jgi:hypothetical protein
MYSSWPPPYYLTLTRHSFICQYKVARGFETRNFIAAVHPGIHYCRVHPPPRAHLSSYPPAPPPPTYSFNFNSSQPPHPLLQFLLAQRSHTIFGTPSLSPSLSRALSLIPMLAIPFLYPLLAPRSYYTPSLTLTSCAPSHISYLPSPFLSPWCLLSLLPTNTSLVLSLPP